MQRQETILTLLGQPHYFALIGQIVNHSFIIIGVTDSATRKNHILLAIGKRINRNTSLLSTLGSGAESSLKMEADFFADLGSGTFDSKRFDITYKANRIQVDDYLQFLRSLMAVPNARISAYCPRDPRDNGRYTFGYTELSKTALVDRPLFAEGLNLTTLAKNSCRTSAIAMYLAILNRHKKDPDISSNFYSALPYKNTIANGELVDLLYVLPLPPSQDAAANPPFNTILHLIYNRLSAIPLTHPQQEITLRKFTALAELYNQLSHLNSDLTVWRECLQTWHLKEAVLINTHRGQALSDETVTTKLITVLFDKLGSDNRLIYPI